MRGVIVQENKRVVAIVVTILAVSILALNACGCAKKGIRKYNITKQEAPTKPDTIEFYLSTLDSIMPYYHLYPTGVRTKAPNLDPREFCDPAQIYNIYANMCSEKEMKIPKFGMPARKFEVLGEVSVDLYYGKVQKVRKRVNVQGEQETVYAPSGTPYKELRASTIEWAYKPLRKHAAALGADAVIEVFCGKGASSYWTPPSAMSLPTYGKDGKVVGSVVYSVPGGVNTSKWCMTGLAVRWMDWVPNKQSDH